MTRQLRPGDAERRLGDMIRRHRPEVVDRLTALEWAGEPGQQEDLVRGAGVVRPRVELFVDAILAGLTDGDWIPFDRGFRARTTQLLASGVISTKDLNRRSFTIASLLIPLALAEPDPEALLTALFATMQSLSSTTVGRYSEMLLEESRRLDDLKTMFLRMTGHELRAPLGIIRGYAAMLREGDLGDLAPAALEAVSAVDRAASSSLAIIDRLVEVARLESGKEALHRERHSLDEVVLAAIAPLRESARRLGVDLDVEADAEAVSLDAEEVAIAIRNLLGNALKYAADGHYVRIRAWRSGDDAWFEVSDRGRGIAAAEVDRVFERYFRSADSRIGDGGGSGLGLYIVRRIAELHGGEATAESVLGEGATFRLRLPAA